MDQMYMRILRASLHLLGSWPYRVFGVNKKPIFLRNNLFLFSIWFYIFVASIVYVKNNLGILSFYELGQSYIVILMTTIGLQRITMVSTKEYQNLTHYFVSEVHLFHHKNKSVVFFKMYERVNKICNMFTKMVCVLQFLAAVMFMCTPIIRNLNSGAYGPEPPANSSLDHALYYEVPFNVDTNVYGYAFYTMCNMLLIFDSSAAFCVFDLYISLIVFHVWGHLKILDHNLRHFPSPKSQAGLKGWAKDAVSYTPKENVEINKMLVENIEHHKMIKRTVDKLSAAFGFMFFIYYLFHITGDCIFLIECWSMDSDSLLKYGSVFFLLTQQLVVLNVVVEKLGTQSETLKNAVYSIPWENMDVGNRRIVLFFLCNVQDPLSMKALGIVDVGVRTMAAIFKTSVSYFMLLRTFATEDSS